MCESRVAGKEVVEAKRGVENPGYEALGAQSRVFSKRTPPQEVSIMCGFELQARIHPRHFLCGSRNLGGGAQSPYCCASVEGDKGSRAVFNGVIASMEGNNHRRNKGLL